MELGAQGGKEGWEVSEQLGCQEMKTSDVCVGVWVSVSSSYHLVLLYFVFFAK